MRIFHIAEQGAVERARSRGLYVAPSLESEGFIHCSTRAQVVDTANRYYRGQSGLVLLCLETTGLTAVLKYEPPATPAGIAAAPAADDQLFPHVYGPIDFHAVVSVVRFEPDASGVFTWPAELDG